MHSPGYRKKLMRSVHLVLTITYTSMILHLHLTHPNHTFMSFSPEMFSGNNHIKL